MPDLVDAKTTWALVVGIDHYKKDFLRPLSAAVKDALRFSEFLLDIGVPHKQILLCASPAGPLGKDLKLPSRDTEVKFGNASSFDPALLENNQLTYFPATSSIIRQMAVFLRERGQQDRLFVYFSGHGYFVNSKGSMFLPHDFCDLYTNIGVREYMDFFLGCRFKEQFFIMDACANEPFQNPDKRVFEPESPGPGYWNIIHSNRMASLMAAAPGQFAREIQDQYGLMTHHLLKVLNDQNSSQFPLVWEHNFETGDLSINFREAARYTARLVKKANATQDATFDSKAHPGSEDQIYLGKVQNPQAPLLLKLEADPQEAAEHVGRVTITLKNIGYQYTALPWVPNEPWTGCNVRIPKGAAVQLDCMVADGNQWANEHERVFTMSSDRNFMIKIKNLLPIEQSLKIEGSDSLSLNTPLTEAIRTHVEASSMKGARLLHNRTNQGSSEIKISFPHDQQDLIDRDTLQKYLDDLSEVVYNSESAAENSRPIITASSFGSLHLTLDPKWMGTLAAELIFLSIKEISGDIKHCIKFKKIKMGRSTLLKPGLYKLKVKFLNSQWEQMLEVIPHKQITVDLTSSLSTMPSYYQLPMKDLAAMEDAIQEIKSYLPEEISEDQSLKTVMSVHVGLLNDSSRQTTVMASSSKIYKLAKSDQPFYSMVSVLPELSGVNTQVESLTNGPLEFGVLKIKMDHLNLIIPLPYSRVHQNMVVVIDENHRASVRPFGKQIKFLWDTGDFKMVYASAVIEALQNVDKNPLDALLSLYCLFDVRVNLKRVKSAAPADEQQEAERSILSLLDFLQERYGDFLALISKHSESDLRKAAPGEWLQPLESYMIAVIDQLKRHLPLSSDLEIMKMTLIENYVCREKLLFALPYFKWGLEMAYLMVLERNDLPDEWEKLIYVWKGAQIPSSVWTVLRD